MVKLYSTPSCPKCKVLEERLLKANIEYIKEQDIDKMFQINITSVPILQVDKELMVFYKALEWIKQQLVITK